MFTPVGKNAEDQAAANGTSLGLQPAWLVGFCSFALVTSVANCPAQVATDNRAPKQEVSTDYRIIEFPEHAKGMGHLEWTLPPDHLLKQVFQSNQVKWQNAGKTSGKIEIPSKAVVRLVVSPRNRGLSVLSKIGKHLSIDAIVGPRARFDDEDLQNVCKIKSLRAVTLKNSVYLREGGLEALSSLPLLEHLSLRQGGKRQESNLLHGQSIKLIGELDTLRYLDLSGTGIVDEDLKHIAGLSQLENLVLRDTQITNQGLNHLMGLSQLSVLKLGGYQSDKFEIDFPEGASENVRKNWEKRLGEFWHCQINDDGLRQLAKLINLAELALIHSDISESGLAHLAKLPKLKSLDIFGTKLSDQGYKLLQSLPALESIKFGSATKVIDVTTATSYAHLRGVEIKGSRFKVNSDAALAELAGSNLASLEIGQTITDQGLNSLSEINSLVALKMRPESNSVDGFAQLRKLSNLEHIQVMGYLPPSIFESFDAFPKLKDIHIQLLAAKSPYAYFEPFSSFENIVRLGSLERLDISGFAVNDEQIEMLSNLKNLKRLRIGAPNVLTNRNLAAIAKIDSLQRLQIDHSWIDDRGLKELKEHKSLNRLYIDCLATTACFDYLENLANPSVASPNISYEQLVNAGKAKRPRLHRHSHQYNFGTMWKSEGGVKRASSPDRRFFDLDGRSAPLISADDWINDDPTEMGVIQYDKTTLLVFVDSRSYLVAELVPPIKQMLEAHGETQLGVIFLCKTDADSELQKMVDDNNIPWPVGVDVNDVSIKNWHVTKLPTIHVIDREGNVVYANIYKQELKAAVDKIVSSK